MNSCESTRTDRRRDSTGTPTRAVRWFLPVSDMPDEAKMLELSKCDEPVVRERRERDEAVRFFESVGEQYKAEIIASILWTR